MPGSSHLPADKAKWIEQRRVWRKQIKSRRDQGRTADGLEAAFSTYRRTHLSERPCSLQSL